MHRCKEASCPRHKRPPAAPMPTRQIQIGDLTDQDLEEIFKRLPLIDRLLVSEVCKRWNSICRKAWLDITQLDLSPIPGPSIAAVIRQCPKLRSVIAVRKHFGLKELHVLSRHSLASLKLYGCSAPIQTNSSQIEDVFASLFSGNLPSAQWDELVLRDFVVNIAVKEMNGRLQFGCPTSLPPSLKRVQIIGLTWRSTPYFKDRYFFLGPSKSIRFGSVGLQQLECLLLQAKNYTRFDLTVELDLFKQVGGAELQNLRELQMCPSCDVDFANLLNLRSLEVFFSHDTCIFGTNDLVGLATKHPSLRIIAFTGDFDGEIDFPARMRYANGFSADPLPVLHIFVGKMASEMLRFPKFPSDAAKVYPISEPLPQFLEREDIAPIFERVWIAEKIKEAAKNGSIFCDSEENIATSIRPVDS